MLEDYTFNNCSVSPQLVLGNQNICILVIQDKDWLIYQKQAGLSWKDYILK